MESPILQNKKDKLIQFGKNSKFTTYIVRWVNVNRDLFIGLSVFFTLAFLTLFSVLLSTHVLGYISDTKGLLSQSSTNASSTNGVLIITFFSISAVLFFTSLIVLITYCLKKDAASTIHDDINHCIIRLVDDFCYKRVEDFVRNIENIQQIRELENHQLAKKKLLEKFPYIEKLEIESCDYIPFITRLSKAVELTGQICNFTSHACSFISTNNLFFKNKVDLHQIIDCVQSIEKAFCPFEVGKYKAEIFGAGYNSNVCDEKSFIINKLKAFHREVNKITNLVTKFDIPSDILDIDYLASITKKLTSARCTFNITFEGIHEILKLKIADKQPSKIIDEAEGSAAITIDQKKS